MSVRFILESDTKLSIIFNSANILHIFFIKKSCGHFTTATTQNQHDNIISYFFAIFALQVVNLVSFFLRACGFSKFYASPFLFQGDIVRLAVIQFCYLPHFIGQYEIRTDNDYHFIFAHVYEKIRHLL